MGDTAPRLDRRNLDHIVGQRRYLLHRRINRAHPQVRPGGQLALRHPQHPAQRVQAEFLRGAPAQVPAFLHHFIKRQRVFGAERKHDLALKPGKNRRVRDDLAQAWRNLIFQQSVRARHLKVAAQQLHPLDGGLALPDRLHLHDGGHQAFDAFADPVVGIMRPTQLRLCDYMQHRLVDRLPGVLKKLVIDAPIRQGQRRHLDQVDKLAWFDQRFPAWPGVDGAVRFGWLGHAARFRTSFSYICIGRNVI